MDKDAPLTSKRGAPGPLRAAAGTDDPGRQQPAGRAAAQPQGLPARCARCCAELISCACPGMLQFAPQLHGRWDSLCCGRTWKPSILSRSVCTPCTIHCKSIANATCNMLTCCCTRSASPIVQWVVRVRLLFHSATPRGGAAGNPSTESKIDNTGRIEYWHQKGLISTKTRAEVYAACDLEEVHSRGLMQRQGLHNARIEQDSGRADFALPSMCGCDTRGCVEIGW